MLGLLRSAHVHPTVAALGIAIAIIALSDPMSAQETASIQGTIMAQDGTPIPGANITYGPMAPPRAGGIVAMTPPVGRLFSGPDGSFLISNLKAGTYLVCVSVRDQPYLDPCHWSTVPATFTVTQGRAVPQAIIRLARGRQLRIRVDDPQRKLANEGKIPGSRLMLWSRAPSGAIQSAVLGSTDALGRDYTITIPSDAPVQLSVSPGAFQLTDASGLSVAAAGGRYEIPAASARSAQNLTFTVTGVGKE